MEIKEIDGHHKACRNCSTFFVSKRSDAKYCSSKCQSTHYKKRLRRKARLQSLLSVFGLNAKTNESKEKRTIKEKIDYARLTFILSVFGFIGSVGFYLGVLREVYSPSRDKQKIELLQIENKELQETVIVLTEKLNNDSEDE